MSQTVAQAPPGSPGRSRPPTVINIRSRPHSAVDDESRRDPLRDDYSRSRPYTATPPMDDESRPSPRDDHSRSGPQSATSPVDDQSRRRRPYDDYSGPHSATPPADDESRRHPLHPEQPTEEERDVPDHHDESPHHPLHPEQPMEEEREFPDHPEDEVPPQVPTPEVDSQVPIPIGSPYPPSVVVIPDEDRFAEAFNNAEDERRIRHQDAERIRDERALEAEARRDDEFREHEAERQRIFEEGERKRNETNEAARQAIFGLAERDRDEEAEKAESTRTESIRDAIDEVASQRHSVLIQGWEEERGRLNEEHDEKVNALQQEWESERTRLLEEHDQQVKVLQDEQNKVQEELLTLRDTTEAQRIEKERVDAERMEQQQMELQERDSGLRNQLEEITNMLREKKVECERLEAMNNERWAEKEDRRGKKAEEVQALKDLIQRIVTDNEEAKAAREQERDVGRKGVLHNVVNILKSDCWLGIDDVLEKLEQHYTEQKTSLQNMANGRCSVSSILSCAHGLKRFRLARGK